MDIFCEYMVKKKKTAFDYFFEVLCIFAGLMLTTLLLIFWGMLMSLEVFVLAGIWYGVWYFTRKTNLEIEYIMTNNVIDIDKIMSQKTRKRVISIDFAKVDTFGEKTGNLLQNSDVKVLDLAADINGAGVYFAEFFKEGQKYRVYFSPNEKILENIGKLNPRLVRR